MHTIIEEVEAENRQRVSTYKVARPLTTSLANNLKVSTSVENTLEDTINESNPGGFTEENKSREESLELDDVQEPTDTIEGRTENPTEELGLSREEDDD